MPDTDAKQNANEREPDKGRRDFLFLLPLGIFAGLTATIATAAFRFLRPAKATQEETWSDVAPLAELKGDKPIMRSIIAEHQAGWASALEEHFVYILPHKDNKVLSSICPHEGCNVAWNNQSSQFFCPCHDSYFNADGERISGPARRGLDPLETHAENGMLKVKYQTFVNNTEERIPR
jgi:Rieske Fe-S protein